jgi:uncharacterized caspase-like protein
MSKYIAAGLVALFVMLCLEPVSGQSTPIAEKRYALVIGNSAYTGAGVLPNPINDATDMAHLLQKLGFDVALVTDGTYGGMREAAQKFFHNLSEGPSGHTTGLFYYAGHGIQYQNENYLVPVDAQVKYEDDVARTCFPVQRIILDNMGRTNSTLNIVILDACRNNPFPAATRAMGAGLAEVQKAKGSFIAYATAPGSVASDGAGRNGLYTQELLKAMNIPNLQIEQVFKVVRRNVLHLSGEKQYTWDSSNILGDFYFIPPADPVPLPPVTTAATQSAAAITTRETVNSTPPAPKKIISDEQLAKELTTLTSATLSFPKKKEAAAALLKKFVVPHAFVNMMMGQRIDERIAANKLLDRMITLPEATVKVVEQDNAASGKIIELYIEIEE